MIRPAKGFFGGGTGIRTPGTDFRPYNGLANRRLKPLGHPSGHALEYTRETFIKKAFGGIIPFVKQLS